MDDPWDVKSVRQAGQYTSCMKLNGSPLLPPVLSKECRKEMQYYKILAKEVEKRILYLQSQSGASDAEGSEDDTDAPELPEIYDHTGEVTYFDNSIAKVPEKHKNIEELPTSDYYGLSSPNFVTIADPAASKVVIDFSLSINQTGRNVLETVKRKLPSPAIELPERDYNCVKNKELLLDFETNGRTRKTEKIIENLVNFSISLNKDELSDPFPDSISSLEGQPSLSSKSFTGSLNDLHSLSKEPKLIRQSSYTLLQPSPQLLAHLEVQSLNTGVDMKCISMSESLSNLSTPSKKRKSWDLESAKVKWSSMAMELKTNALANKTNPASNRTTVKPAPRKTAQSNGSTSPLRQKSLVVDKKRITTTAKPTTKSEPLHKLHSDPFRNPSNVANTRGNLSTLNPVNKKKDPGSKSPPKQEILQSEDPATKVRELYEKIQKQQLIQMASLVEKQKREQMLLQQVFEEQNNLLFKQLKTIVPTSPIEAKEAWGDKTLEPERGPVSLSQLINQTSPESSPVTSTLTDTNKYINKCDDVLKKSRDLSGSIKKSTPVETKNQSARVSNGSKTRTHSPVRNASTLSSGQRNIAANSSAQRNTSRRLNYDTTSSERDGDPMLTDRTNDTMADLNVTFPTDNSDCEPCSANNTVCNNREDMTVIHASPCPPEIRSSTESAISCMERAIHNSMNSTRPYSNPYFHTPPSPREIAAASKLVACAKGHLTRRLMRTERVTATVQTIRDALLCALQLHQDREGIRGADVDLHRRLIQQITAACYSLHDTFITSSPAERCAMLAADRARRRSLAYRLPTKTARHTDIMSQSHCGAFPARPKRALASTMTQSTYETYSVESGRRPRHAPSPRRRPWR